MGYYFLRAGGEIGSIQSHAHRIASGRRRAARKPCLGLRLIGQVRTGKNAAGVTPFTGAIGPGRSTEL